MCAAGRGTAAGGVAKGMTAAAGAAAAGVRRTRLRSQLGVLDSVLGVEGAGLAGRMED